MFLPMYVTWENKLSIDGMSRYAKEISLMRYSPWKTEWGIQSSAIAAKSIDAMRNEEGRVQLSHF